MKSDVMGIILLLLFLLTPVGILLLLFLIAFGNIAHNSYFFEIDPILTFEYSCKYFPFIFNLLFGK
jgi:hypothetical protein